jgi:heme O synthase-like polyprenyltransferase
MKQSVLINLLGLVLLIAGFVVFIMGQKMTGGILSFCGVIIYLITKAKFSKA